MTYELYFKPKALKEWEKLDKPIKEQFKKKLRSRLKNPKIEADRLRGYASVYKIKLRSSGFRLAYKVEEERLVVLVLKVGKREKFYDALRDREDRSGDKKA